MAYFFVTFDMLLVDAMMSLFYVLRKIADGSYDKSILLYY